LDTVAPMDDPSRKYPPSTISCPSISIVVVSASPPAQYR
jgi:hypothetical protein